MNYDLMNTREQIFEIIENAVTDAFLEAQNKLNIENGDIDPLDDLFINEHTDNLAEYIFRAIEIQYNRKKGD